MLYSSDTFCIRHRVKELKLEIETVGVSIMVSNSCIFPTQVQANCLVKGHHTMYRAAYL